MSRKSFHPMVNRVSTQEHKTPSQSWASDKRQMLSLSKQHLGVLSLEVDLPTAHSCLPPLPEGAG